MQLYKCKRCTKGWLGKILWKSFPRGHTTLKGQPCTELPPPKLRESWQRIQGLPVSRITEQSKTKSPEKPPHFMPLSISKQAR